MPTWSLRSTNELSLTPAMSLSKRTASGSSQGALTPRKYTAGGSSQGALTPRKYTAGGSSQGALTPCKRTAGGSSQGALTPRKYTASGSSQGALTHRKAASARKTARTARAAMTAPRACRASASVGGSVNAGGRVSKFPPSVGSVRGCTQGSHDAAATPRCSNAARDPVTPQMRRRTESADDAAGLTSSSQQKQLKQLEIDMVGYHGDGGSPLDVGKAAHDCKKGILVARPQHVTMGSRTVAAPPGSSEMKRDTSFGDTLNLSFIDDSDIDEISRSPSHKSKSSFPDYYHAPNASFDSSTKSDPVIDRDPAGKGSSPTKERKKDNSKPDMEKKPTGKATTKTPEPRPILAPTEIQVDVKEPLHETPRSRVVHYFPCCAISCDQLKAVAIVLFAFVLAIIVIVVISTTTQKNTQAFEEASATVFIGCGLVTGKHEGDVLVFRGIPYAEPPVGTMRWRPPNPLHSLDSCWNGTFDGTKAAPACYQGEGTMKELSPLKGNMSEDCLTLNVWTPDLKRQKHTTALPVVVYIHGDQFIGRDEDTLEWGPNAQQTKITNMVWVSFNYRVGALGFLALDGLASNSHSYTSGNYGLMDQIAALEWVRDNIRAFGGDPESVTLLGQGSGATSIVALLTTPLARGLYHAAWLSSPAAGFNPRTRAAIYQDNLQLMSNLGCNDVECARRQPPATVMQAFQPTLTDYTRMPTPDEQPRTLAIVDGHIVAADIVDLWQRKIMNDVPIIIGASSLDIEVPNLPSSDADVTVLLEATFRPFGATVWEGIVEHYGHSNNTAGHWKRKVVEQILADLRVTCPLERLFAVARLAFHSAHFYVYDYQPDRLLHRHKYGRTSRRGVDVAALLGQLEGPGKADEQFTLLLVNSFIRFAQTHRMPTEWQVGKMGEIGQDLTPREMGAARMERCHFWTEEAGFYPQHAKFD